MKSLIFSRNGFILPITKAVAPIDKIERMYGFGVYESLKIRNSILYFVDQHVDRLLYSARCINLQHNFTKKTITAFILDLSEKIEDDSINIKILLLGERKKEAAELLLFPNAPLFPKKEWYRNGVPVFITYAKPVGDWEGNFDAMVNRDDMDYVRELEKQCDVFTHLTPSYSMDIGCIAVKRMVSITKYGDVMPCPYMHVSLGNFFKEPLKDIIERGLNIKYFGQYYDSCYMAEDREFIDKYIVKKVYGKPLPVPSAEVFTEDDLIKSEERKLYREQ